MRYFSTISKKRNSVLERKRKSKKNQVVEEGPIHPKSFKFPIGISDEILDLPSIRNLQIAIVLEFKSSYANYPFLTEDDVYEINSKLCNGTYQLSPVRIRFNDTFPGSSDQSK